MALALGGAKVDWHYYCPSDQQGEAAILLFSENISHHPKSSDEVISFRYFHPLSKPVYSPASPVQYDAISVSGESILRFGFMEGDARVEGRRVVYDPQSPNRPVQFYENGSRADELAIVLNSSEVVALGGSDNEEEAVKYIGMTNVAKTVLVKAGAEGCRVYLSDKLAGTIPPYRSELVYKIGSGDVFSAAFAFHWAMEGKNALEAADAASRCTAHYCGTRLPSVRLDEHTDALLPVQRNKKGKVYIAGPFFTMAELWLIEEAWAAFTDLGVDFFSPYHEVGVGQPEQVVQPDLDGLNECTAVFAVLDGCDPGTIFEIGYAVRMGIPVVALSQNPKKGDQTMLLGSAKCYVTDDFSTAIYRAAWECWT